MIFNCRKCLEDKPTTEFIKDKSRKIGHHPYCRVCQSKIKNNKRALYRALKWQKDNPEKRKSIRRKWRLNNPELTRIYRHLRRDRVKSSCDGTITKDSLSKLQKDVCCLCNNNLDWGSKGKVHLDHIIPLVKGGLHTIDNVRWTCSTCNLRKGSK